MLLDDIIKPIITSLDSKTKPIIIKDFTSTIYSDEYNLRLNSANFSIIEDSTYGGKYIIIIRYFGNINNINIRYNKSLYEIGNCNNYITKEDKLININKSIILDENFNIIKSKIYISNKNNHTVGLEDIRLIKYNNELYFMGYKQIEILDHKNIFGFPVRLGIQMSKFDFNKESLEDNTFITPNFIKKQEIEKNWVHFTMKDKSYFIYNWNPITITRLDIKNNKLVKYKTLPYNFKNIRGSTNGIIINNEIWFLVHEKKKYNILFRYYHRFIVFDLNMNLIKFSNEFKFNNKNIEFCLSMIKKDNDLLLSYSYNDNRLFLKKYNIDQLNNSLKWFYNINEYKSYNLVEPIILILFLIIIILVIYYKLK